MKDLVAGLLIFAALFLLVAHCGDQPAQTCQFESLQNGCFR